MDSCPVPGLGAPPVEELVTLEEFLAIEAERTSREDAYERMMHLLGILFELVAKMRPGERVLVADYFRALSDAMNSNFDAPFQNWRQQMARIRRETETRFREEASVPVPAQVPAAHHTGLSTPPPARVLPSKVDVPPPASAWATVTVTAPSRLASTPQKHPAPTPSLTGDVMADLDPGEEHVEVGNAEIDPDPADDRASDVGGAVQAFLTANAPKEDEAFLNKEHAHLDWTAANLLRTDEDEADKDGGSSSFYSDDESLITDDGSINEDLNNSLRNVTVDYMDENEMLHTWNIYDDMPTDDENRGGDIVIRRYKEASKTKKEEAKSKVKSKAKVKPKAKRVKQDETVKRRKAPKTREPSKPRRQSNKASSKGRAEQQVKRTSVEPRRKSARLQSQQQIPGEKKNEKEQEQLTESQSEEASSGIKNGDSKKPKRKSQQKGNETSVLTKLKKKPVGTKASLGDKRSAMEAVAAAADDAIADVTKNSPSNISGTKAEKKPQKSRKGRKRIFVIEDSGSGGGDDGVAVKKKKIVRNDNDTGAERKRTVRHGTDFEAKENADKNETVKKIPSISAFLTNVLQPEQS